MKTNKFWTLLILAILLVSTVGAVSADSGCLTFTRDITGDSDSGFGGYWAHDTYTSTYEVCPGDVAGTYDVTRTDEGTFETFGGTSPSGLSTVGAGVTGTINGTWTDIVVTGDINPAALPDLGDVDFQCDTNGNCANYSSSLAQIFNPGYVGNFPETWEWAYTGYCDGDLWVNAADGSSGDIVSEVGCSAPVIQPVILNGGQSCSSVAHDLATLKYTDESERYLDAHPFCRVWFPGYFWYWQQHQDQLH